RAVVGQRRVLEAVLLLRLGEALLLGHLGESVRIAAREVADHPGEQQRDHQAGEHERSGPAGTTEGSRTRIRTHDGASVLGVRISSRCSDNRPRAPWTRSGRTAITLPMVSAVMTPSPMPISTWTPTMA